MGESGLCVLGCDLSEQEADMEKKEWNPGDLLQLSGGYWSACALHAGVKLDLFTPLTDKGMTARDLAERLKIDARGLGMLLNALAALQLLDKQGLTYVATPFSSRYLDRTSPEYLGYIIRHH